MSAKLSSTLAGMALLECPFLFLVLGPVLCQGLAPLRSLQDTAPAPDKRRRDGLEKNTLRCGLDHCFGSILDVKLFAQAKRDDDLPLCSEPNGLEFFGHTGNC